MKKIAVIGASQNKKRFSNKCIRAYQKHKYEVEVINPHYEQVEDIKTIHIENITSDTISVYVNPEVFKHQILRLPDIVKKAYLNPGTVSNEVLTLLKERNIKAMQECSIITLGENPNNF